MTTQTVSVSFATDSEDFISRACEACGARFKVKVVDGEATVAFCPFCKHQSDRWETPEQLEYGKAYVAKLVVQPELDRLNEAFERLGDISGSGLRVTVSGRKPELSVPAKPAERIDDLPQRSTFDYCETIVRHENGAKVSFCIRCGNAVGND